MQRVIEAANEKGVRIFFNTPGSVEYESFIYWPNGLEDKSDIIESMEAVADATNGDVFEGFVPFSVAPLDPTSLYQKDTQRFHVILEAGEENVCYGHNNFEGFSEENAKEFLRRNFDWGWQNSLDFCSTQKLDGTPNDEYVFCDAMQFNEMILDRILEIKAEHDKTNTSAQRLTDISNFTAALIVDGYGDDFLQDFAELSDNTLPLGIFPKDWFGPDFDFERYVNTNPRKFNYEISCDQSVDTQDFFFTCGNQNTTLPTSGFYDVFIDIEFEHSGIFLTGANSTPSADITINLELKQKISQDNLLYFIPFDGELGEDSGKLDRQNYGVDYSGDEINLFVIPEKTTFRTIESAQSSNGLFDVTVNDLSKDGQENQLFQRLNKGLGAVNSTRGVVLKIIKTDLDSFELEYSPGYAAPVLMELTRDDANPQKVEGYYSVSSTLENYLSLNETAASWSGIATSTPERCKDFEGRIVFKNQPAQNLPTGAGSNCSLKGSIVNDEAFGFSLNADSSYTSNGEKVILQTTIFNPTKNDFYLIDACRSGDQAVYYTMNDNTSSGSVSLGTGANFPQNKLNSVSELVEGVKKTGNESPLFCIYTDQDVMEVWFNESLLKNKIIAQRTGIRQPLKDLKMCLEQ